MVVAPDEFDGRFPVVEIQLWDNHDKTAEKK
jgi:hypothetical protein